MSPARRSFAAGAIALILLLGACQSPDDAPAPSDRVPDWAPDAVVYQIFPERFANGDPTNDPTRASLTNPEAVPASWRVSDWTGDWYDQTEWERQMGGFYESVYDRRYGGDLQGVIDRLPYLDSLGVNTLYFNPVFWSPSLHKYDGRTFHHIDPHFGPDPAGDKALIAEEDPTDPSTWHVTAADSLFFALLEKAHARDLRVIIDGVFNHTGRQFFAFRDLAERQRDSRYADWYEVRSFDDPQTPDTSEFDYAGWAGLDSMPEFAVSDDRTTLAEGPRQYIFDATARWMDPNGDGNPSDGVDGWRLDVAEKVPVGFWADWHAHVRSINPEAYTVAEVWEAASGFLREGGFSATMNYHGFAYPVKGFLIDNTIGPSAFAEMMHTRRQNYAPAVQPALLNLIDSHDTPRLATMLVNRADTSYARPDRFDYDWGEIVDLRKNPNYEVHAPAAPERRLQRLVALTQMTTPGLPMIYYGTAAGMWGADDPDDRKPMVWPDRSYEVEDSHPYGHDRPADSVQFNHALFDTYRSLIALRTEHTALRRGASTLLAANDERQMLAYARSHTDAPTFVTVINRSDEAHSARIPLPDSLRASYTPAFETPRDGAFRVQQDGSALLLELPPHAGLLLRQTP
jgi:glycosidase